MKGSGGVWSSRGISSDDENSLTKRRIIRIFKWIIYSIYLVISYVLMMSPDIFSIAGIKPLLIVPLVVCVSIFEGELAGGVFGIFSGLVWGCNTPSLFTGYYSLILFVCCVVCGLLVKFFLKIKHINALLLCAFTLLIYLSTSFFFRYGMWNYSGLLRIFTRNYIPTFFYTLLVTPIYFILIKWTHGIIRPSDGNDPEEEV